MRAKDTAICVGGPCEGQIIPMEPGGYFLPTITVPHVEGTILMHCEYRLQHWADAGSDRIAGDIGFWPWYGYVRRCWG
jgi:hypothetical protein